MANCDISFGRNQDNCKDGISGLKAIYLANYDDYEFVTQSGTASGHVMTDLGELNVVYKYGLKNTANTFQQDITSSRDNGTTFYNQVLNFTLTKVSKEMDFQVKMMALGRPIIFVEYNTGQIVCMGAEHGAEISGNSQIQGTMDALNGYVLTATGMERELAWNLDSASVTALKALASVTNL